MSVRILKNLNPSLRNESGESGARGEGYLGYLKTGTKLKPWLRRGYRG